MEGESEKVQLKPLWNFDRTDARDELNLAEFPLAAIASRVPEGQKTLVFEDQIWDEGRGERVARKLTISGSDQFGLPTAIDNDVLLALIHLTKCRNGFTERTLNFSRYELVRFLQWDDGGKSYKRLEQSLNVLASVTLFYNHAWWDKQGKSWRNRTFHILESVELRGRDYRGESEQPTSSFTWNGVVFDSFTAHNIKKLNLEVYFQLESSAARQAYRFLDKRFYLKRRLEFELKTFACEHLGFSRSYDTGQLKRKLEPALEELEKNGFLVPMSRDERFTKRGPGDWIITLERKKAPEVEKALPAPISTTAKLLIDRGVSPATAAELADTFSAEVITAQVKEVDRQLVKKDHGIKNTAGFLVKAIRESYAFKPEEDSAHVGRPKVETVVVERVDPREESRERFWNALSEEEKSRVLEEALKEADGILLEGWKRAQESGAAARAEGYRTAILAKHIDRRLGGEIELKKAS